MIFLVKKKDKTSWLGSWVPVGQKSIASCVEAQWGSGQVLPANGRDCPSAGVFSDTKCMFLVIFTCHTVFLLLTSFSHL